MNFTASDLQFRTRYLALRLLRVLGLVTVLLLLLLVLKLVLTRKLPALSSTLAYFVFKVNLQSNQIIPAALLGR
jgi:hypothetical protein